MHRDGSVTVTDNGTPTLSDTAVITINLTNVNEAPVVDDQDRLVGVIRLGDPAPGNFSPLYRGQVLVHGLGFSPDHRALVVVSIGSNSATFGADPGRLMTAQL